MSEETQVILNDKKNNDLKNIFINYKKTLIVLISVVFISLFSYFFYTDYKKGIKQKISEKYNLALINFNIDNPNKSIIEMKNIINKKDPTYAPLALYFLLDNNLLKNKIEINQYFDILINDIKLDKEIKNLIIYKKGLYNSDFANEEELLNIFNPLLRNENLWTTHSLYVIAEYFFSKGEKQKSREFFEKLIETDNSNPQLKIEAQKRLQRDFGD